jgi:hypothetical protein
MHKENMVYTHSRLLFSHKEKNYVIYKKMNGTGDHNVKQEKQSQTQKVRCVESRPEIIMFLMMMMVVMMMMMMIIIMIYE